MAKTLAEKILGEHIVEGKFRRGQEIGIRIDQTLTQDATGTMAYLQFESMGIDRVKTDLSVSYVDHNTLQTDFRNADDHLFLQSIAEKYGIWFSRPGNGICHQVHLERFAVPGGTLLGSDSHTPTAGGAGMIAIGAGGLDVACAMAGEPFYLTAPAIVNVKLEGKLSAFVSAKDVALDVLRRLGVAGGFEKILEYTGDGVKTLGVPERATITNMGTETGATTSVFPSDGVTKSFMEQEGRGKDWVEISPDAGAKYDEEITIDLSKIEPLVAAPHSPGNVKKVRDVSGTKVNQVMVGSCTNSSLADLKIVANLLEGRVVNKGVSLFIAPGSRQVVEHLIESGEMNMLVSAGARILECACGPCIGMGGAPPSGSVSVRTFNRNFPGRSGTSDAGVYLSSPAVAAACAVTGEISDPRDVFDAHTLEKVSLPKRFIIDDSMIIPPGKGGKGVKIIRGPNIKPMPAFEPVLKGGRISGEVLLKVGDDISTDDIMPAGAKILPLRSNIPEISKFVFSAVDEDFAKRAAQKHGGFIIGGKNYGQGSSREHAAIAPRYLGVKAVIVKSFARIHAANLVNFGILPLEFENPEDYDGVAAGNDIEIITGNLISGKLIMKNKTERADIPLKHNLGERDIRYIIAGGKLNYVGGKFGESKND